MCRAVRGGYDKSSLAIIVVVGEERVDAVCQRRCRIALEYNFRHS